MANVVARDPYSIGPGGQSPTPERLFAKRALISELRPQSDVLRLDVLPHRVNGRNGYNGQSYSQSTTVTVGNIFYAVAYNQSGNLIITKRTLGLLGWEEFDLSTVSGNPLALPVDTDNHNNISIIRDYLGYFHITANMHGDALRYVRSANPDDITSWVAPGMTGVAEGVVTYPRFFRWSDGTLGFTYRDGVSGSGDVYLNIYNPASQVWTSRGKIADGKSTDESPYENRVVVDRNDRLWLSFSWRPSGGDTNTTNDIFLIYSDDQGQTFYAIDGTAIPLPLVHANTDAMILDTADTNSGIMNQYGMDVDLNGYPHIATMMADGSTPDRNIHHIWWDGTEWHNDQVTNFGNGFGLLTRPSRPCILCTAQGRILIAYTMKAWGQYGNAFRMIDVTNERPVDFPIAKVPGLDFEITFADDALRDQNVFRALIGTCNFDESNPSPDYHDATCFNDQWAGVLSIDLDHIDRVAGGAVELPTIRTIASVSLPADTAIADTASAIVAVPGGLPVNTQIDARGKMAFARLSARARPTSAGTLTLMVNEGQVTSGGSSSSRNFLNVPYTVTSSSRPKATVWAPLSLGPINNLEARAMIYAKTSTGVAGTIASATLEIGVLEGSVYL